MTRNRILLALVAVVAAGAAIAFWHQSRREPEDSSVRVEGPQKSAKADGVAAMSARTRTAPLRAFGRNPVVDVVTTHGVPVTDDPHEAPPVGTFTSEPAPQEPMPERDVLGESLNHYMKELVGPRVRECWKRIPGNGQIEFRYTFRNEGGNATPTVIEDANLPVTIVESSLEPAQSAQALDCMLDAIDGTSFSLEGTPTDPLIFKYQVWTVGK